MNIFEDIPNPNLINRVLDETFSLVLRVVDKFIFKNNVNKLFPCSTFVPKTGIGLGLPKTGISFLVNYFIIVNI